MRRRWSGPSRIYTAASVASALLAGVLLHAYLTRVATAAGVGGPSIPVVVAATDVGRGSALQPSELRVVAMPRAYVPPGSFERISQAAGRIALAGLAQGEAVTRSRLARVRAGPVASLTPEGLRAFAIPTSLPVGAAAAGDHVDVLATYGSGQPHTETVVSSVEVLMVLGAGEAGSVGGSGPSGALDAAGAGAASAVTLVLLVSPDQEERLAFAAAFANLAVAIAPADGAATGGQSYPGGSASNQPSPTTTTPPPTDTLQESPSG